MGFDAGDIVEIIETMRRRQFYKSMTGHFDHQHWHNVVHVPSSAGMPYINFTSDLVAEFRLLSFKERDNA